MSFYSIYFAMLSIESAIHLITDGLVGSIRQYARVAPGARRYAESQLYAQDAAKRYINPVC